MSYCDRFDEFLSRDPDIDERAAFEAHLAECSGCATALSELDAIEKELFAMAEQGAQDQPAWSPGVRKRLIERAVASGRRLPRRVAVLRWAAVSIAVLAVIGGAIWGSILVARQSETAHEPLTEDGPGSLMGQLFLPTGVEPVEVSYRPGEAIRTPADGRMLMGIGADRVGLDAEGELGIVKVGSAHRRFRLERGTVACSVDYRTGGGEFVVEVGRFEARVVGTRFAVTRTGAEVEVLVSEGRVEVTTPGQEAMLVVAGEVLKVFTSGKIVPGVLDDGSKRLIEELLSDDVSPASDASGPASQGGPISKNVLVQSSEEPPKQVKRQTNPEIQAVEDLDTWRGWVIEGRLEDAARGLESYLKKNPKDSDAWWLLAGCRRKANGWPEAVEAYREVIAIAPTSRADLARFRAGAILQERLGRHREAVGMFEAYLESDGGKLLRAEAMVRLGRSLLALGRRGEARRMLQEVVARFGGNPVAAEARELLGGLKDEEPEQNADHAQ